MASILSRDKLKKDCGRVKTLENDSKIRNFEAKNQGFPDCDLSFPNLIWMHVKDFLRLLEA